MQPTEFRIGVIKPIECVKEAWQVIKPDYWLLFAIFVVGALTGAVTAYVLIGAMICGIMNCYLKRIDGYEVKFEDLWKGIKFFWPSLLVTILFVVPLVTWIIVITITVYLPLLLTTTGTRLSGDDIINMFGASMAVDIVVALVMICLHTLLSFSFPLVVDRGLTGISPITVSARAVLKNLGGIGGLIVVNFVLILAGELACFVGLYLVAPLVMATSLVAYRKVFPAMTRPKLEPPPPNAYAGL